MGKFFGSTLKIFLYFNFLLIPLIVFFVNGNDEASSGLLYEVNRLSLLPWLETNWAYFYLLLFIFSLVFLLSFDKKVAYYRAWRFLLPSITIVACYFIIWDLAFAYGGVWGFNGDYITGFFLGELPIEEILFFFVVPFACIFIYECIRNYFNINLVTRAEKALLIAIALAFWVIGLLQLEKSYSACTFLLAANFTTIHLFFLNASYRSRFFLSFVVSFFPFLIINGALTGSFTQAPIVLYNPDEYLGIRIQTIPVDDLVYSFFLLFSVTTFYEYFREKYGGGETFNRLVANN